MNTSDVLDKYADSVAWANTWGRNDRKGNCVADLAAEVRSLRDALRALVQSEDSGVHSDADWGPVCAYCGENDWIRPYEHTESCPILKARELLAIPPDGIKEVTEHGTEQGAT